MQQVTRSTVPPATHLDALTLCHTAFRTFQDLLDAKGGYTPSLRTGSTNNAEHRRELAEIADAYDAAQQRRGDARRACRS
jgi:hypothetical protein